MKKVLKVGVVLTLVLSMLILGACGGAAGSKKAEGEGKGKIAYIVGNLGDKSFSDSGEAGMNTLRGEGWDVKTIETGGPENAGKYEDLIRDALDQGYTYLVASSTYGEQFYNLAKEYSDAKFLIFDDKPADESAIPENISYIFYAQNEGSYLVGMLAAAMSKSGTVAVDVGIDNPVIGDFVTGYIDGAKAYNPDIKVIKAACGSWNDPAAMKKIVEDQAGNNKADVFYQVAGGSGDGLFEACVALGAWAIGVDSDQYQSYKDSENPEKADVILTSMLKEVGNSFVSFFHSIDKGEDVWGKTVTLGLAEDSVGYVDNAFYQENVPEDVRKAITDAAEKVKSGELKVKSYYDFASEDEYTQYLNDAK